MKYTQAELKKEWNRRTQKQKDTCLKIIDIGRAEDGTYYEVKNRPLELRESLLIAGAIVAFCYLSYLILG